MATASSSRTAGVYRRRSISSAIMPQLLDTMKIPHRTLTEAGAIEDFKWIAETFMKQRIPVALFITKGVVKGLHP